MKDKPDNSNNRFCPRGADEPPYLRRPLPVLGLLEEGRATTLSVKKTREHGPKDIAEFRIVEDKALDAKKARPQPVWKIAYAGAIGGQAMTGIPAIERLREKFSR